MVIKCNNGVEIKIKESQRYVKVIAGNKTWYWNKETGEFDGTSFRVNENQE